MKKPLGRHGNIFRIMVQAALQRAAARGQKKIIFQAGYANEITQRRSDAVGNWGRELITAENLASPAKKLCPLAKTIYPNKARGFNLPAAEPKQ